MTPSGEEYTGFSVTIGGITDPAEINRNYDDLAAIFKANQANFKVSERRHPDGTFQSFDVSTE